MKPVYFYLVVDTADDSADNGETFLPKGRVGRCQLLVAKQRLAHFPVHKSQYGKSLLFMGYGLDINI